MPLASIWQNFVGKVEKIAATYTPEFLRERKREVLKKLEDEEVRKAFADYQLSARRCVTKQEYAHIYDELRRRVNETQERYKGQVH